MNDNLHFDFIANSTIPFHSRHLINFECLLFLKSKADFDIWLHLVHSHVFLLDFQFI